MTRTTGKQLAAHATAAAATAAAVVVRWLLDPVLGESLPLVTLFGAVAAAVWVGGYRPALLAAVLGYAACAYLFIEPRGSLGLDETRNLVGLLAYLATCSVIIGFGEAVRVAQRRFAEQKERLGTTLASIGDAVITTDVEGRITNLNAVAETLTGWTNADAVGQPLDTVFNIVNEETRQAVESPATRALKEGVIVGLANHTVLIARDGTERPIDDSAAPIRCKVGEVVGCVLVFRDVTERRRVERERLDALRLKQVIADNAATGIIMQDGSGRCTFMNPAAEVMTGFTFGEMKGKNVHDAIHHKHADGRPFPMSECEIGKAVTGRRPIRRHEDLFVRKDGTFFPVVCNASPVEQGGALTEVVLEFRDITEEKRAEQAVRESERRYRSLAEALPQLVWTDRPDGTCDYLSSQWETYTGIPVEELLGFNWLDRVLHPDDRERTLQCWLTAVADKGVYDLEYRIRRHDGEYRWFKTRGVPIRDEQGRIVQWFGTCTDIEDFKRAEGELRRLAAELSGADRRKDEFLATLAHELRNPLAPIRNGLQVMRLARGDAEAVEQSRDMMERQLDQMVRLVDDLMDVSRITRGKLELKTERLQLAVVVNSAVEISRPLIEQMGHELTVTLPEQPVVVEADLTRLAQVFLNLLNNAAKYSDRGGHIRLAAERQGSDVVVSVKDTGIGIAADQLPRLFVMFSQVDRSLEKAQGGLGIGLTLVKRLVEMHGGRVEVKSEGVGKGSEFVVRLPVVVEASVPPRADEEEVGDVKSALRILIVDDNRDGADSLSMMLKVMGNETRTAYDGEEAVAAARAYRPDVILLDIGLPKLNGYEACRRIRAEAWGKGLVIIAQTGWGAEEDRQRTHDAGFDHHVVKPVDLKALEMLLAGSQTATARP